MTNVRDTLLGSLSENTRRTYEHVLSAFIDWAVAAGHYSPPVNADPYAWLREHRAAEVKPGSRDVLHCERLASAWFDSLSLDPLSRESRIAILSAIFARLLPRDAGY